MKNKKMMSIALSILILLEVFSPVNIHRTDKYGFIAEAMASDIKINFQAKDSEIPDGYIPDYGEIYGSKNGYNYGWNTDHSDLTVTEYVYSDLQLNSSCGFHDTGKWVIELENGYYDVTVSVGDLANGTTNTINVEDINFWNDLSLSSNEFLNETKIIQVKDGRLTVDAGYSQDNETRINYIEINKKELSNPISQGDVTPPTVPKNLNSQSISHNEINLLWDSSTDDVGVQGYIIYRNDDEITTVTNAVYYRDTNVTPATKYLYEVAAFDNSNNVSSKSNKLEIITPTEPGNGVGLKGEYYKGSNFEELVLSRTDQIISFDWESGAPADSLDADSFSVRWEGKIEPRYSEKYTFYTETHGEVRLWVDNQLLIDKWDAHGGATESGIITLIAGQQYDIKMEYAETKGAAYARLSWESLNQSKEVVPSSQLYPPFVPNIPNNIVTKSTSTTIELSWDEVPGASGYDIEVNGNSIYSTSDNIYFHENLQPNTDYKYRVRSKIPGVTSSWSSVITETTKVGIPSNINFKTQDHDYIISWGSVDGAAAYDIEVDGKIIDTSLNRTYVHEGLLVNTNHTYRVRGKNVNGLGDWSSLITKTFLASIPSNIHTTVTSTSIVLTWDEVPDAIGYKLEVDGEIINNGLSTTYIHSGLEPNTQHSYRVRAIKADGPGEWSPLLTQSTLLMPGQGTGLIGEYYDDENLEDFKSIRIDDSINFHWRNNSPALGIEGDEYSIRWTGQMEPLYSENYTFYADVHGGLRLWVDGKLLIEDWEAHNMIRESSTIQLKAGRRYDIKMEYRETNGSGKAFLSWSSLSQTKEIIPKSQLYPIGIPKNITTNSTRESITLTWDKVTYAESYDIEVDGTIIDNGTSTTYVHSNLVPGTQHTYRVRAKRELATGEWSSTIIAKTLLGKPVINFEAAETFITVSWEPVYGAKYYDIEVDGNIINNDNKTTYIHDNLQSGTEHTYRVRARSEYVVGDWTSIITKWTLPDIPSNISTSSTSNTITVRWDEERGAIGYDIEVYGTAIDNESNTDYTQTGLNPNTQYTYRVRAKNSSGVGKWSSIIAETTLSSTPQNLEAISTDTSIKVTWDAVSGAEVFEVLVDGEIIEEVTEISYFHSPLLPNTPHTYSVRAKNNKGASQWSETLSVTTLPSIPTNLSAVSSDTKITVSWDEVVSDGYDIEVDGVVINNGSSTTYVHSDVQPNSEHFYRVRARKGELTSFWSEQISTVALLGKPLNLTTTATSTEIRVSWDAVSGAEGYDIEVDGEIIDNGLDTTYIHSGLTPNTQHTYRVRARNAGGAGEWSETVTEITLFGIPVNLKATSTSTTITLTWDSVPGATSYDILVDGQIINSDIEKIYIHENLEPNTWHFYRVRAKSGEFVGDWSEAITYATLVGVPTNVIAEITSTKITISWNSVEGATGYEIEVDGVVFDLGPSTTYIHDGLDTNTIHEYRVRAKNDIGIGEWSSLLSLIIVPGIPENLRATATTTEITLEWDEVEGATEYDVEVDGELVEGIKDTKYIDSSLKPNTWHVYKVRAKNEGGASEWSEEFQKNTNPEIEVNVGKDNMFNFVMVAPQKEGVTTRTIVVNYNPDEIEVIDLSTVTPEVETKTGSIEGTNIEVVEFTPGKIKYEINDSDKTVVNSIKFMAKVNEYSKITYSIE